jgi:hypothetical protein
MATRTLPFTPYARCHVPGDMSHVTRHTSHVTRLAGFARAESIMVIVTQVQGSVQVLSFSFLHSPSLHVCARVCLHVCARVFVCHHPEPPLLELHTLKIGCPLIRALRNKLLYLPVHQRNERSLVSSHMPPRSIICPKGQILMLKK